MAKSGGVLNAICAKLLKGNLTQGDVTGDLGKGQPEVTTKDVLKDTTKDVSKDTSDGDLGETAENLAGDASREEAENDFDTDKENNNTAVKLTVDPMISNTDDKEDSLPPPPSAVSISPTPLLSEGRKNKRKSGKPRNIVEFRDIQEEDYGKDELDEFEINNRDVDFDEIYKDNDEDEEEEVGEDMGNGDDDGALDLSGHINRDEPEQYSDSESVDRFGENVGGGVLDLSVMRDSYSSSKPSSSYHNDSDSNDDNSRSKYSSENYANSDSNMDSSGENESYSSLNLTQRGRVESQRPAHGGTDAAAMKNYAQNTVSELLSMYGLSDEAGAITQNIQSIPLQKFSAGHILQHQPGTSIPHRGTKRPAADDTPKPPKVSTSRPGADTPSTSSGSGSASHQGSAPGSTAPAGGGSVQSALASFVQQIPNEGMYAKFVDSFSKLAKLPQGKTSAVSKFATSAEYVKACFNPNLAPKLAAAAAAASGGKAILPDYSRYIKRFPSYEVCGGNHCRDMSYKEHFHCMDCSFRVFVKKEEMIRHFKWHKKRDESLQHGFMRYSPMDDCSKKFSTCTHNSRQTHYHCLQPGCNKVYISTSDTQMHANYHRKDSAIIQEGFQRFRATEDCGTQACSFYGQRTTHFHCRRNNCHFTFKNKADMEKHKAYHQKDEILGRDGFKKFMKYEHCGFANCRYSKQSNHIHCIRPGCEYVLHSTGQLYSHKRRHERRDFEHAYRRFKDEQKKKPILPADASPNQSPMSQRVSTMSPRPNIINPARSAASSPHPIINPAHSKLPPQPSPIVLSAPKLQQNLISPAHTNTTSPAPRPLNLGIKQESEYIDLEDLNRYNRSQVTSPDISMTPTDLSISSTSSTSPTDVKQEPPAYPSAASRVSEPPAVGLDLTSHKPQASTLAKLASKLNSNISLNGSLNLPIPSNEPADPKPPHMTEIKTVPPPPSYVPSSSGVYASSGVAGFIPKNTPPVNDKREKDETWKKYLTRYTANDPCHPRCQFLYKDHYHCNIEGCGMIFRNKDGVREHARYHEQQDRITQLSFKTFDANTPCVPDCQLSKRAQHYHCLWADCGVVIRANDPPFTRLEHHKIHEYARAATSRQPRQISQMRNEHMTRRRGRPPKYPKTEIPVVPKVMMSEAQIANELRQSGNASQNTLLAGFKKFEAYEACPDERCIFISKPHFHCVRPRCHHATDRADVLNLHAKDFHSYINILEGFEFFDRTINCRRPHCHNNKANKHFHCVRPRCDYSFVRYSTMAQHDKKHKMMEMGKDITQQQHQRPQTEGVAPFSLEQGTMLLPNTVVTTNAPTSVQHVRAPTQATFTNTDQDKNVVKTAGTFFPLTSMHSAHNPNAQGGMVSSNGPVSISVTPPGVIHASTNAPVLISPTAVSTSNMGNIINIAPKPATSFPTEPSQAGMPLTMLLQQRPQQSMPPLSWLNLQMKMHYTMSQNCGRPFCKLKKKDHFHCFDCNQAFSEPNRLKAHILKHGIKVEDGEPQQPTAAINLQRGTSPTPITIAPIVEDDKDELANLSEDDEDEDEGADGELNPSSSLNLDARSFTRLIEAGTLRNAEETPSEPAVSVAPTLLPGSPSLGNALDLSVINTPSQAPGVRPMVQPHKEANNQNEDNKDADSSTSTAPIAEPNKDESEEQNEDKESENSASPVGSPSSSVGRRSSRKRTATRHDDFVDTDIAVMNKQRKISSPKPSVAPQREESVPEGYRKVKFTDDCEYERCAYRLSSSHYHCIREDCRYSFTDRTRAVQHTQKHERIDSATGEEFRLVSLGQRCDVNGCEHANGPSHYHCLKCPFTCTDATKVLAHRKHHTKMDSIASKGL